MSVADWKSKDKKRLREWLSGLLRERDVTITFMKQDGSERVMKCTLQEGVVIPYEPTTDRKKEVNLDNLAVWDVEKDSWRSFKLDSIVSIEAKL